MNNLPQDPVMLLSVINTKLRDVYAGLPQLCEDLGVDEEILKEKLRGIGYEYDEGSRQFR